MTLKRFIPAVLAGLMAACPLWANKAAHQSLTDGGRNPSVTLPSPSVFGETPDVMARLDKGNAAWLQQLQQKQQQWLAQQQKPQPVALYFLSFSIPEEGLKLMLPEAHTLGIPVFINGLINNDFRQTVQAVFRLTQEGNNGGVQIDPTQFARFGITAVPALVVTCGEQYDVIRGNIRVSSALAKVAEQGACAQTARQLLEEATK